MKGGTKYILKDSSGTTYQLDDQDNATTFRSFPRFEAQPYARVFGGSFLTSTATPIWMMLFLIA
jgi:hypothetical protein